jgi:hypothetical protein
MGHEVLGTIGNHNTSPAVSAYDYSTPLPSTLPCPGRSQFVPCRRRTVSGFANLQEILH